MRKLIEVLQVIALIALIALMLPEILHICFLVLWQHDWSSIYGFHVK